MKKELNKKEKKKDFFSTRFFTLLLLAALIITVINDVLWISSAPSAQSLWNLFTGAATSSAIGEANITISSSTSLTNQNTLINFGSGTVNASCNFCLLDSNGTSSGRFSNGSNTSNEGIATPLHTCCVSFTLPTAGFLLENTGNNNVSVGYTCAGNCTTVTFFGSSTTFNATSTGIMIRIAPNNIAKQSGESGAVDTSNSCRGGGSIFRDTQWNITNATAYAGGGAQGGVGNLIWTSLQPTGSWLCGNYTSQPLMPDNDQDAGVMDVWVFVPSDAPATGTRTSFRLTFNATDSSG